MNLFTSIIINNYNYGCFLREAIDSALNQTFPKKEIIVVDDGSTDGSQEVIHSYGTSIRSVFKENGGQASSYNAGFSIAKGELILFLDADDFLYPECLESVTGLWKEDFSKAHYPMNIVDEHGIPSGKRMPRILNSGNILPQLQRFGHYSSAPGSGNVYAARFLQKIFPLPEKDWRGDADSLPVTLAPLFGDILGLAQPLAAHRIHGRGSAAQGTSGRNNPDYGSRLDSFARREELRYQALQREANRQHLRLDLPPFPQSPHLLRLHIEHLLLRKSTLEKQKRPALCRAGIRASLSFPGYRIHERALLLLWFVLLFFFPGLSMKYLFPRFSK